ncbi:MAG TPA: amidohydrolase family protein [Saprospiraceae bacterium]|nr:amidohydrolase family protein [Saprospiraceae bacterium]
MAIEKLSPDLLFTGEGEFLSDKVLISDSGKILDITEVSSFDPSEIHFIKGILCPGFVNTHCHLELSHMAGLIPTGTGLLPFLQSVVGYRDFEQELIDDAIQIQDEAMYNAGISAVGDISNKTDTLPVKSRSPIRYYTFVEMFDFLQASMTAQTIQQYQKVHESFSLKKGKNKVAYAPHAPYTVTNRLFEFIRNQNETGSTVSIHNQETIHENLLFRKNKGDFHSFFQFFGFTLEHFHHTGKSSIHYAIEHLDPRQNILFVHNTTTRKEDIVTAHNWNNKVFWATCPNANLYIENSLPDYSAFIDTQAVMTIGTDSLSSNWQLSVLEEIKTIYKYKSFIPLHVLFQWATSNGAKALGWKDELGSFKKGTRPGMVLIDCKLQGNKIDISKASVVRLG